MVVVEHVHSTLMEIDTLHGICSAFGSSTFFFYLKSTLQTT